MGAERARQVWVRQAARSRKACRALLGFGMHSESHWRGLAEMILRPYILFIFKDIIKVSLAQQSFISTLHTLNISLVL